MNLFQQNTLLIFRDLTLKGGLIFKINIIKINSHFGATNKSILSIEDFWTKKFLIWKFDFHRINNL